MSSDFLDESVVQQGQVPQGQVPQGQQPAASTEPQAKPEGQGEQPKPPEPLTEKRIQEMIAEATAKAVKEAKETGKRELQSAQDRNKAVLAKAMQRAQTAELALTSVRQKAASLDPAIAKEVELEDYRARETARQSNEQTDAAELQRQEFHKQFVGSLETYIKGLGVDPADDRIDWAEDAPNYIDAQRRILESVAKIQKAEKTALESSIDQKIREATAKIKKELGYEDVNSVETSVSSVPPAGSDRDFIKKFGAGELPMTKENIARYNKITSSY